MNYSTETVTPEDAIAGQADGGRWRATRRGRRRQRQRAMWSMSVVMVDENGEDSREMSLIEDQQVVETLRAYRAYEAFGHGVGLWGANRCA